MKPFNHRVIKPTYFSTFLKQKGNSFNFFLKKREIFKPVGVLFSDLQTILTYNTNLYFVNSFGPSDCLLSESVFNYFVQLH